MTGLIRWIVIALVVLGATLSFLLIRASLVAGEWTTLKPIFDGECSPLEGFIGAEDMAFDPESRIVYAAGVDRRAALRGEPVRGAVWAIPFDAPASATLDDLTGGEPEVLIPHGVDHYIGADGVRRLLVVNHRPEGDAVEIFRLEGGRLAHERTVTDPLLRHLNDVAAVGPDAFYFTIDKEAETGSLAEIVENLVPRARGSGKVGVYDAAGARVVDEGLLYANGVAVSADGRTVYAAETVGRALRIYDRDPATNALTRRERPFVGTGLDNIFIDAEGRLFIAAHPKLLTFAFGHAADPAKRSPSQVILIEPAARAVDQIYLTEGEQLSAASIAIVDVEARRMLLGSVFEPRILSCRLPEVWRHSEAHPASRPVGREGGPE